MANTNLTASELAHVELLCGMAAEYIKADPALDFDGAFLKAAARVDELCRDATSGRYADSEKRDAMFGAISARIWNDANGKVA